MAGNNITIKEALLQVEQQTRMSVGYDESILDSQKRVAKKVENATLRSALDAILEGTACSYEINGNYIVIVAKNAKVILLNNDNDEKRRLIENCQMRGKRVLNPIIDWTDEEVWL